MSEAAMDPKRFARLSEAEKRAILADLLAPANGSPFPLTDVQESYFVGRQLDGVGCHLYLELFLGDVDEARLEAAWNALVRRHDALRVRILVGGSQIVQSAVPHVPIRVAAPADPEHHVAEVRGRLVHRLYGEDEWPLFSIEGTRTPAGLTVHLSIDCSILDGSGLRLLLREWQRLYERPAEELPPIGLSFREYVLALRALEDTPRFAEDLQYWVDKLTPPVAGPALGADGARRRLQRMLDPAAWERLRESAREWRVPPSAILLTAFGDVLARHVSSPPFAIVLTHGHRPPIHPGVDALLAPASSTSIFVFEPSRDSIRSRVENVQAQLWRNLDHDRVSGIRALRELRKRRLVRSDFALPVTFTSNFAVGDAGWFDRISYSASQTPGIALDHQAGLRDGTLQTVWDVAGPLDAMLDDYLATLERWSGAEAPVAAAGQPVVLTALQEAYVLARPAQACTFYQELDAQDLDVTRLADAWRRCVEHHDALRMEIGHGLDARILPRVACGIRELDLRGCDKAEERATLARIREEMAGRVFDPARAPLFDVAVTHLPGGRARVHFAVDLVIASGAALRGVLDDWFRLYADPQAVLAPRMPGGGDRVRDAAAEEEERRQWRAKIEALPPSVALQKGDGAGARERLTWRFESWSAFSAIAATRSVRPGTLLLAAFAETARVWGGGTASTITLVDWRNPGGPTVGDFTAVTWLATSGDGTFGDRVRAAEEELSRDLARTHVAGLEVMREIGGAYPVVFTYPLAAAPLELPPGFNAGYAVSSTPGTDLDVLSAERDGALEISWDFSPGALARGSIEALREEFTRLLDAIVADDTIFARNAVVRRRRISAADLRVLDAANATEAAYDRSRPIQALFEEQAAAAPERIATICHGESWTYGRLDDAANRLARRLRRLGVGPGLCVGVCLRRSHEMVMALLAILKAGGAYVPLDPANPADRLAAQIDLASIRFVVTEEQYVAKLTRDVTLLLVDDPTLAREPAAPAVVAGTTADDLAYVIFTSGSTGAPKGVAVQHGAVMNLLDWLKRTWNFGPAERGLFVVALGFDLSVADVFALLGFGGSLHIADDDERTDPERVARIVADEGITFWNSAPSFLQLVVPYLREAVRPSSPRTLRLVFLSGDWIPLTLAGEVRALFPRSEIVGLGGATEATVWSNYFPIGTIDPSWRSIPYGKPIQNCRYHVLDELGERAPVGEEGDLYIAGDCLCVGYIGAPDLTAAAFVPDPFSPHPAARMYRTGDRARYFSDGNLEFLGRNDRQVKVRGYRIELDEVEHWIERHPQLVRAAVTVQGDGEGRRLVAYCVARENERPAAKEIRELAAQKLPDYMVPSSVVFLPRMPLSSNGKLDRKALPWPVTEQTAVRTEPAEPVEEVVRRCFAEELRAAVDPAADLFDLGLTSLSMIRVTQKLRSALGVSIPVRSLLAEPTVEAIARLVIARSPAPQPDAPSPQPDAPAPASPLPAVPERKSSIRIDAGVQSFALPAHPIAESAYRRRASWRSYLAEAVPLERLGALLSLLRCGHAAGGRKYLYPSAGSTYAVQTHVYVRDGAVAGLPGGAYYYHPEENHLVLLTPGCHLDRTVVAEVNRDMFDEAAFFIVFIAQLKAIEPSYGQGALALTAIEAGYMAELLMLRQGEHGIGLCPIGGAELDALRVPFRLGERQVFVHGLLGGAVRHVPETTAVVRQASGEAVAVVGVSGRYPGADTPRELWTLLRDGRRAITELPVDRTPAGAPDGGGIYTRFGGFLRDIARFDHRLFRMTPMEARAVDPQERLLLEVVWECLEDAGWTADALGRNGRVGVFVGAMWGDYQAVGVDEWSGSGVAKGISFHSSITNRISSFFDFRGPSVAVDTSCSSALTALHLACESIRHGECEAAIVGAVNLVAHPYHQALLCSLQLLSREASSGALGADAAGWVIGEGVAAVLLRPAAAAEREGDSVRGLVRATGIAHSGRARDFGMPNAAGEADFLRRLLRDAAVAPETVGYVEVAAAGAGLADAAEIEALADVFGGADAIRFRCSIGSIKPNVGHLEAASGLSQLTKVLLQFEHGELAPSLDAEPPSPFLPTGGVLAVNRERVPIEPRDGVTRALVNAVGATGSCAAAIVDAPRVRERGAVTGEPAVIVLSAMSDGQLRESASRLAKHLHANEAVSLDDVAFTLQNGRVAMDERLAVVARDLRSLCGQLEAFARGDLAAGVFCGTCEPGITAASDESLESLARQWTRGAAVTWPRRTGRRVPLPAYVFGGERHWMDAAPLPAVAAMPQAGDETALVERLREAFSRESGLPLSEVGADVPFERYGLGSLLVMRINQRLESQGIALPSRTVLYECRDLAGVARHLLASAPRTKPVPAVRRVEAREDDIAIVGMAGRYPMASNLTELWANLLAGRDCVTEIPRQRWDHDALFDPNPGAAGRTYGKWGGFLDGVDCFDPLFFSISPREAEYMDPQERLFLEVAWELLEDAGYTRAALQSKLRGEVGVFVGVMYADYQLFSRDQGVQPIGVCSGTIANRVSYVLDLSGPSMAVDTLCSSSLTSIHLACESLRRGESRAAIAGGVNLCLHPNRWLVQAQSRMLSTDGRCRAFGAGGDGLVPGEGVGAAFLKRRADAIADGDRIHAVIKATAVNHGGRTSGFTVPNPVAHASLIGTAIERAGLDAESISYIEVHGTGTALGDPIELNGLVRAFGNQRTPCAIGSIKSNVGHLESAAGIAGLTKVVLQLRNRRLVPSLHAEQLNPQIDFDAAPFYVQREPAPWERSAAGVRLRAAVSSFGAGGANAHVILEEHVDAPRAAAPAGQRLIVLSARNRDRLDEAARRLLVHLDRCDDALADVAWTLQTGREAMEERLAIVAGTLDELRARLRDVLDGREHAAIRRGVTGGVAALQNLFDAGELAGIVSQWVSDGRLSKLAEAWVQSVAVDWSSLPGNEGCRLVSLPAYPFARELYWVPRTGETDEAAVVLRPVWRAEPRGGRAASGEPLVVLESPLEPAPVFAHATVLRPGTDLRPFLGPGVRIINYWSYGLALEESVASLLDVIRALVECGAEATMLVVVPAEGEALAAFARSVSLEHPRIVIRVVIADERASAANLLRELDEGDDVVSLAGGERHVRRLEPVELPNGRMPLRRGAVVLVTGGLGGVGRLVAEHLTRAYGAQVVLAGRSAPSAATSEWLVRLGATCFQADVARQEDVRALVVAVKERHGRIDAVVHAAGVLHDGRVEEKSLDDVRAVIGPKVHGAVHLDEALADEPLEAFVLFSSASGSLGNRGQCDYALANAYLDFFARKREEQRARGLRSGRTLSIGWPLWESGGMRVPAAALREMRDAGLTPMPSAVAMRVFDEALASSHPQVVVLHGERALAQRFTQSAPALAMADDPAAVACDLVRSTLAEALRLSPAQIAIDENLEAYGVDSITLRQLDARLSQVVGPLPQTLMFECRTVRAIADYLTRHHASTLRPPAAPVVVAREESPRQAPPPRFAPAACWDDGIAVIGLAGRYPNAANVHQLWRNLASARESIVDVPPDRWDSREYYDPDPERSRGGKMYTRRGGFLEDVAAFDPRFFGFSQRTAELADPQERLFLEVAWETFEDAGYTRASARAATDGVLGANIAVFLGATTYSYLLWGPEERAKGNPVLPGTASWSMANRVSHALDLVGPSVAVDTACSSGLTAIHLACASVRSGECRMALAGGVNLYLHPTKFLEMCQMRMLSPSGRCRPFGDADGTVVGEGAGAVLLAPLRDAIARGDHIYGVIRGSAVNHSGRTNGFTVPDPESQAQLIRAALAAARVDARTISFVEAHGTGTKIGDPIEVAGLTSAFRDFTADTGFCGLGTLKANIGHLESAAGVVGLTKVLLQMKHGQLAPHVDVSVRHPEIDFERSPFRLIERLTPWVTDSGVPRRAGISSFGAGGSNGHLIVEEYRDARPRSAVRQRCVVPLSARTPERLRAYAAVLADALVPAQNEDEICARVVQWAAEILGVPADALGPDEDLIELGFGPSERSRLNVRAERELGKPLVPAPAFATLRDLARAIAPPADADPAGPVLADVAHTFQFGREPMRARAVFEAEDARELAMSLRHFAAGGDVAPPADEEASTWLSGADVRWSRGHGRRVPLPPYPFEKIRCWFPRAAGDVATTTSLRLEATDPVIADHRFGGALLVAGAVSVDLALAAARHAGGEGPITLCNVVWVRPLIVAGPSLDLSVSVASGAFTITAAEVCVQGRVERGAPAAPAVDLPSLRARLVPGDAAGFYRRFVAGGVEYGPSFRVIESLGVGNGEALARLRAGGDGERFELNPLLLDGAFQTVAALLRNPESAVIPFALRELTLYASPGSQCWAHVVARQDRYDVEILNDDGAVLARALDLTMRAAESKTAAGEMLLLEHVWRESPRAQERVAAPHTATVIEEGAAIAAALRRRGAEIVPGGAELIVDALALRGDDRFLPLLALARNLMQADAAARVVVLHRGAAEHAALAAFARTIALESTRVTCSVVEIDELDPDRLAAIALEEAAEAPADIRRRGGTRQVRGWRETAAGASSWQPRAAGVYLVTGGGGALGVQVARRLLIHPSTCVVLSGRSAPSERASALLDEAQDRAAWIRADIATDARRLVAGVKERFGRIDGVVHCAGVIRDALIRNLDQADAAAVLSPKIDGAQLLDDALRDEPLDVFVLFSSIAGMTGNSGQAAYAYANAFLDEFAERREELRRRGERQGRTVAIAWPLWSEGGMTAGAAVETWQRNVAGLVPLETAAALDVMGQLIGGEQTRIAVVHGDAARIRRAFRLDASAAAPTPAEPGRASLPREEIEAALILLVSDITRIPAAEIDLHERLENFGFDSVTFTDLATAVNRKLLLDVTPAIFFEHRTLATLVEHFLSLGATVPVEESAAAPVEPAVPAPPVVVPGPRSTRETATPIAIVGMSGMMPGCGDLDQFWRLLASGGDAVREVPPERWDWRTLVASPEQPTPLRWGAFLEGVDRFDAEFFGISPREARLMDPQQRLFLQAVWTTIEQAGWRPSDLAGSAAGIFVGVASFDYAELLRNATAEVDGHGTTGLSHSILANRISYLLDLRGPSEPVDTACSSSLVAVHRAVEAIQRGDCDQALAGGVNLILSPFSSLAFTQAGMLSADGRCRVFDARANGYVRGEGVGCILLKRLAAAERDGDTIHGVILGSAVNHGGRANTMTTPNPNAQADVIVRAHLRAGVDPATIGCIEAHGTGTSLGDPVEVNGLRMAFAELFRQWGRAVPPDGYCGIGSVKSNIGHLETAAGIAGMLKVLLAMRHRTLPATIHCEDVSSYVRLAGSPFYILRDSRPWSGVRRAGISSFGYGGSNAHVVLEEHAGAVRSAPLPVEAIVLSARNGERLRERARDLLRFLEGDDLPPLDSIAWTLQVGREAMDERLALVAHDLDETRRKLAAFVDTGARPAPTNGDAANAAAAAWLDGRDVDWLALRGRPAQRVPLPTYPFAPKRHWPAAGAVPVPAPAPEIPPPTPDRLLLAVRLRETPLPRTTANAERGTILILSDGDSFDGDFRTAVAAHPLLAGCKVVEAAPRDAVSLDDVRVIFRIFTGAGNRGAYESGPPSMLSESILAEARGAVDLARGCAGRDVAIWFVLNTSEAQPHLEALTALGRSLAGELPRHRYAAVALPFQELASPHAVNLLLDEWTRGGGDAVYRGDVRFTRQLVPLEAGPEAVPAFRRGGVYVVAGGTGEVGRPLVEALARRHGVRMLLLGRSAATPAVGGLLAGIRAAGGEALYEAVDLGDESRVAAALEKARRSFGPIEGVLHLARVVEDGPAIAKDDASLARVLRAKVLGSLVLDRLTAADPLAFFVVFSSIAGVSGLRGSADYAYACEFQSRWIELRAALRQRGARRGISLSLCWPQWRYDAYLPAGRGDEIERSGLALVDAGIGLDALEAALATGEAVVAPMFGDAVALERIAAVVQPKQETPAEAPPDELEALLAGLSDEELLALHGSLVAPDAAAPGMTPLDAASLADSVQRELARVLELEPYEVTTTRPFDSMGLDSILGTQVILRLEGRLGIRVPPKWLFEYNTVERLATQIAAHGGNGGASAPRSGA